METHTTSEAERITSRGGGDPDDGSGTERSPAGSSNTSPGRLSAKGSSACPAGGGRTDDNRKCGKFALYIGERHDDGRTNGPFVASVKFYMALHIDKNANVASGGRVKSPRVYFFASTAVMQARWVDALRIFLA